MKLKFKFTTKRNQFIIFDEIAANYLNISTEKVHRRLMNKYSNTNFVENKDYIKTEINSKLVYIINHKCFEKLELVDESI